MAACTVTIAVADFVAGRPPADVTARVERGTVDVSGSVIISAAPTFVPLTGGTGTIEVEAGVPYRWTLAGVHGLPGSFYAVADGDTDAATLYRAHQIDPTSLAPLPSFPTYDARLTELAGQLAALIDQAPGNLDSFFEAATRFGLDEATVTALQTLVAGKAPLVSPALTGTPTAPTAATGDSSTVLATTAFVKAVVDALALGTAATHAATDFDPAGAAAAVTLAGLGGVTLGQALLGWAYAQSFRLVSATRDTNEAITTGSVVWPDGATGTFTTDAASAAFPGAIDAYHVTHVLNGTTLTVTQPAVTRDAGGAVVNQPALTVA